MTIGSDGRFAINNVQADNSLIIGCFGYKTQIIKPDFTSEMIVKLMKDTVILLRYRMSTSEILILHLQALLLQLMVKY